MKQNYGNQKLLVETKIKPNYKWPRRSNEPSRNERYTELRHNEKQKQTHRRSKQKKKKKLAMPESRTNQQQTADKQNHHYLPTNIRSVPKLQSCLGVGMENSSL